MNNPEYNRRRALRLQQAIADDRGVVVGWLVRVLVLLAAIGLVLVEGGSLLLARYAVSEASSGAASAAALELRTQNRNADPQTAVGEYLQGKSVRLVSMTVDPQTATVTVVVRKTAKTYLVHRIEPLRKYTIATDSHSTSFGG